MKYEHVRIQQPVVVVKSQKDEKYALLTKGTGHLQNFTANNIEVRQLKTGKDSKKVMLVSYLFNEFIQIHSLFSPK